jgi:hypothetical protein
MLLPLLVKKPPGKNETRHLQKVKTVSTTTMLKSMGLIKMLVLVVRVKINSGMGTKKLSVPTWGQAVLPR